MKTPKVLRDFPRLPDNALDARATNVSAGITGNAYFTTPSPSMAVLDAARLEFSTALATAQNGDRFKISLKNDAKLKLRTLLYNLAYYVESVAMGSRSILVSSGFTISLETSVPPAVDSIDDFKVEHGNNSGQIMLSANRVKGVNTYSFYFGFADGASIIWDHVTKTSAKTTISNLQVGKTYTFYIMAIGAKGKYIQSASITKVVS